MIANLDCIQPGDFVGNPAVPQRHMMVFWMDLMLQNEWTWPVSSCCCWSMVSVSLTGKMKSLLIALKGASHELACVASFVMITLASVNNALHLFWVKCGNVIGA